MCYSTTESQTSLLLSISTKQPSKVLCIREMGCEHKIGQSKPHRSTQNFQHSLGCTRKLLTSVLVKFGLLVIKKKSQKRSKKSQMLPPVVFYTDC